MKKILVNLSSIIAGFMVFLPLPAFAQPYAPLNIDLYPIMTGDGANVINIAIWKVVWWLVGLASALAVGYLVWGGIQYIMGNAEQGKKAIVNAITGIIVIILSFVIIMTIKSWLGA